MVILIYWEKISRGRNKAFFPFSLTHFEEVLIRHSHKKFFFESGGMGTRKLLKFLEIVTNRYLQTCYSYKHPYTDTSAIGGEHLRRIFLFKIVKG